MSLLASYDTFIAVVRTALFYGGVVVAAICVVDWAVRTRRINAFSRTARFFRGRVDPVLAPVERVIIRAGGSPGTTPWWSIVAFAVFGILLISVLRFVGGILTEAAFAAADPRSIPRVLLSWAFGIVKLALLVRVLSSWLPVSPRSKWIRWSFVLTEWMLAPLRRFIPLIGMLDITPIVAYFLLSLIQGALSIP
jgi:YggT family protein